MMEMDTHQIMVGIEEEVVEVPEEEAEATLAVIMGAKGKAPSSGQL